MKNQEINEIAENYIKEIEKDINIKLVIASKFTIIKPYGIIFFYHAKDYDKHQLAGNAPFLVEKETGNIVVFGTAHTEDYYIQEYEEGRWPKNRRLD